MPVFANGFRGGAIASKKAEKDRCIIPRSVPKSYVEDNFNSGVEALAFYVASVEAESVCEVVPITEVIKGGDRKKTINALGGL